MDSWHYDDVGEDDTETDSKFFGGKEAIIFLIDIASPGIKSLSLGLDFFVPLLSCLCLRILKYCRAVGRSENLGVPVLIRWA